MPYLLDTNAYFLLFQRPVQDKTVSNLLKQLTFNNKICCYISEITSLEIYSVLGKYRRGIPRQKQTCSRLVLRENGIESACGQKWITKGVPRLNRKQYGHLLKLLTDIENQRGNIIATICPLSPASVTTGIKLLQKYSDQYNFGSHDAIITGTFMELQTRINNLILITSDKGLKSVLKKEFIPFYDPKF